MTPIILIDHGQCSHVAKTKNAQDFGLKAAIIIDDDAWDLDSLRKTDDFYVNNEIKGFQLTIPYFKIFSSQGKKLIHYLENTFNNQNHAQSNREPIYLKINLDLTKPDNRVEYELWYSSILDLKKN